MSAQLIDFPTRARDAAADKQSRRIVAKCNMLEPGDKARVSGIVDRMLAEQRDDEPCDFHKLAARIQAARPDLGWSAACTVAHEIERGETSFEAVATGEPLTAEYLQPVVQAYDTLRKAEALVDDALHLAARHSGRSVISVKRVLQHFRKGHRIGPPPPDGAA